MPIASGCVFFDSEDCTTRDMFQGKIQFPVISRARGSIDLAEGHKAKAGELGATGELNNVF